MWKIENDQIYWSDCIGKSFPGWNTLGISVLSNLVPVWIHYISVFQHSVSFPNDLWSKPSCLVYLWHLVTGCILSPNFNYINQRAIWFPCLFFTIFKRSENVKWSINSQNKKQRLCHFVWQKHVVLLSYLIIILQPLRFITQPIVGVWHSCSLCADW